MGVTEYNKETADRICKEISERSVSLRTICKDKSLPCTSTIYKWLTNNKSFAEQYARARDMQADLLAEEILEIADNSQGDTLSGEGGEYANHEWINRSKLRVDARKWLASKLAPKKYGDKIDHTSGGDKLVSTSPETLLLIANKINNNAAK